MFLLLVCFVSIALAKERRIVKLHNLKFDFVKLFNGSADYGFRLRGSGVRK